MEQLNMLKEQLPKGEELLWSGRPEGFEVLDAEYKPGYIKRVCITLLIAIGFCAFYIFHAGSTGMEVKPGIIVIIAAFAAFVLVNPFSDVKKLKKNYLYAVTNKRVVIVTDKVKGADITSIPSVAVRKDAAGNVSFLFAEAGKAQKASLYRSLAVTCTNKDGEEFAKNIAFYAVKDSEGLKKVLRQFMPVA